MKEDTAGAWGQPGVLGDSLTDLLRNGARGLIEQAVAAELALLLEAYRNVTDRKGRRAVVRNGYLPERDLLTGVGNIPVRVPKVRDRSGRGIKFNSALVPPSVRKAQRGATGEGSPPVTGKKRCRCCWAKMPRACRQRWSAG